MSIDLFQRVEGVAGESADANHSGWTDILSVSWGASQAASISGGGAGAGKVSFSDLTVTANMDKATPTLLKMCAAGKHISKLEISFQKAGGTAMEFSKVTLTDVLVTGVQFAGASGGEQMQVNYSYQAAKVQHSYWVQDKSGSKGAETQMGWDVKGNVATA